MPYPYADLIRKGISCKQWTKVGFGGLPGGESVGRGQFLPDSRQRCCQSGLQPLIGVLACLVHTQFETSTRAKSSDSLAVWISTAPVSTLGFSTVTPPSQAGIISSRPLQTRAQEQVGINDGCIIIVGINYSINLKVCCADDGIN